MRREQYGAFGRYALNDSIAGVPLDALYQLIVQFVADEYDEKTVDAELKRRGIRTPGHLDG